MVNQNSITMIGYKITRQDENFKMVNSQKRKKRFIKRDIRFRLIKKWGEGEKK